MKALSWVRSRPKALASGAALTVGLVTITSLAFAYEGNPTTEVDLNDGGVWITKSDKLLVGHFNNESTLLDGGLFTTGSEFDILQDESTILVVDHGESTAALVDPARVALDETTSIPGGAKVALGEKTTAILEPTSGGLWVVPAQSLNGFEFAGSDPDVELGKGADVTVADDGTVFAVSPENAEVVTIPVNPQGDPLEASTASVDGLEKTSEPKITAVGTTPVVLDPAAGVVLSPGGFRTEIPDADTAVLQQSSRAADAVTVATASSLVEVPLDGSEPQTVSSGAQGVPAAPVSLLGCSYGAWAGSAKFVRDCPGDDSDLAEEISGLKASSSLAFRVNRDVIVLNDIVAGAAWIATDSLQQVDNWNDITPPEGETDEEEETTEETVETSLPERSEQNTPPVAEDDDFGVRPGGTTMLPVVDNDTDADGDVLVASLTSKQPSIGEVQPINNGSALQIAVPEDATGSASFEYQIEDGRGGTDTATVTVSVHDWSVNAAPTPKRKTTLAVEAGGTISYNVLPDWIDPDGDDMYLKDVAAVGGDEVDFTTDGQITYRAVASPPGRYEVQMVVADASGELANAEIQLDVRPVGSTLPKTNADHVVTKVGQQVTVSPLTNDTSSSREQLRLNNVDKVDGATITPDYPSKTFTFKSDSPGVYYVQYLVTAGVPSATGIVRIDVEEETDEDLAPIAVRDVALLPTGGEVLVGVLNNDSDPGGGILVVQSVTVEPGSGISVSVLNHETLRIGDQGALDEQVRISYRISNGKKSAEGDVVVVPIAAPDKLLPPVANDDTAKVRVGDVVTIPVLDNDSHPNELAMHVAPELVEPYIAPEDGEAFVSQDAIRFKAGPEAKTVYATYEVIDENGQKDAGYVTIQILPIDEEKNSAPRPRDVTVRTISGSVANIAIPLDGIDADGDSVELLGLDSSPKKGRVTEVAQNYLVYQAFEDAVGLDSFTYKVRDNLGKEGVATVHVGIAPGEESNQAPYAVKDSVVIRPGREVAVPVMANDSDPEGDTIALVKDGLTVPDNVEGLSARVSGDRVLVQAPEQAVETSLQYKIVDERGAEAEAVLQITVDEDVPLLYPIARDDRVTAEDLKDGAIVDVEVLANDEDPDGTTDSLTLTADGAEVLDDGKVRVEIGETRQLIRYTITDEDDQPNSAFIFVPALTDLRPIVDSTKSIEVVSGETVEVPLNEYVTVAGGGSVVITEAEKISAGHANGDSLIKDERTLIYTSAQGYFGTDALNFEVTDGDGPDDPNGRKATLSVPITVLPPENQQPTFLRGEMTVAPGEDATSLDLAELTDDPDPEDQGKHSFTYISGAGKGLSARIEGSELLVEAASNTPKGTAATILVRITDGETEPIEGTVDVRVTASTRSLPTANTDTFPESDQGKTITVPVLANDVNPFEGEGPLELLGAERESGDGTVKMVGDKVEVTPGANFVGVMTVRYRIGDITKDPDREVDGQIVLTVQGVPDAPGVPTVSSVQDRTVVLSWTPPANNGAEITGYTVKSVQGNAYTKQCSSTTCTLDGLTNNVKYLFQVTATNRVGDSEPSPSSAEARPDARPDTPLAPTLTFGDRELKIDWKTPTTPGSPVEYYTIELVGGVGAGQKTNVTGNSYTWTGLENGASYTARVRAHNLAPDPSSWSPDSLPEIPAGPPAAPGAPTTTEMSPVGDRAQMNVSWNHPDDNGDALDGYELQVRNGSNVVETIKVGAGNTSQAVVVNTSTTAYTFVVRAENKAGWGGWSPASAPRRGVVKPDAPGTPSVTPGDRVLTVNKGSYTLSAAGLNGATAGETNYQYSLNGGGWQSNWDGTTIGGVNNGTTYTVRIRAVATVGGSTYASDASGSSAGQIPFGIPPKPSASARNNGTSVTLSWSSNGDNGAPITTQVSINGGNWKNVGNNGSETVGNGYQQTHDIKVRVSNKAGTSGVASASARTNDPPPPPQPKVWVTQGAAAGSCVNGCRQFVVNFENLNIGTRDVRCYSSMYPGGVSNYTYRVNFNGNGSQQIGCWTGRDGQDVWVDILGWGGGVDTQKNFWQRP